MLGTAVEANSQLHLFELEIVAAGQSYRLDFY